MRSVIGGLCAVALAAGATVTVALPASAAPATPAHRAGHATSHHGEGPLGKAAHHRTPHISTGGGARSHGRIPRSQATPATVRADATTQAAGTFVSLTPARLLDTRSHTGGNTPGAGGIVHLQVTGKGGVPTSGVSAVVLNVTVTGSASSGYVTVYADGTTRPTASSLNFPKGATVPNLVVAPVNATTGKVALYNGSKGAAPLVADVSGYYVSGTPTVAGAFKSLTPARLLDTRSKNGGSTPKAKGSVTLQVAGRGLVPTTGVAAVVLNVTAVSPTGSGYVTVYGSGKTRPTSSNLNFTKGQIIANQVIAPLGSGGKVVLYNGGSGSTPLVADVAGYYRSGTPTAPGAFQVLPPKRVMDTRSNLGSSGPGAKSSISLSVDGSDNDEPSGVPSTNVAAVVMNVTVTNTTAGGYITVYNDNDDRPNASNLNFVKGQTVPNLVYAPVSNYSYVDFYNGSTGPDDLLADVAGYFLGDQGSLSGTVTAASDGSTLGNIDVELSTTGDEADYYDNTYTDDDGTYSFDGVDAGDYQVCFYVTQDPDSPGDPNGTGYAPSCDTVTVSAGSDAVADAALVAGGAVSGMVTGTDTNGTGLGNVEVDLYNQSEDGNGAYANTDEFGNYRITSLATGSYEVCFYGSDATGGSPGGYQENCLADDLTVTAGQELKNTNVSLDPGGAVSGSVTLDNADSSDDINWNGVDVFDQDGNFVDSGSSFDTNTSTYRLGGLPSGTYTVCFEGAYDNDTDVDYAAQCYDDIAWDQDFGNLPSGTTSVVVTAGQVREGADVTLHPSDN